MPKIRLFKEIHLCNDSYIITKARILERAIIENEILSLALRPDIYFAK